MTMHPMRRRAHPEPDVSTPDQLGAIWRKRIGRRGFLRQAGIAGAAAVPLGAVAGPALARERAGAEPTEGDFALLRFLCAAEIIESDLWEQYAAFGGQASSERPHDGGNPAYIAALLNLDGDMPQYISDNTDDEESHQLFLNAYLMSKGQRPVNLERFRTLPPQPGDRSGGHRTLTNLTALNVDTSWYLRYRAETNPDLGATFRQAVTIRNQPAIPLNDTETPPTNDAPCRSADAAHQRMQAIANAAGFHFAMIEQGGSSLYSTLALKATSTRGAADHRRDRRGRDQPLLALARQGGERRRRTARRREGPEDRDDVPEPQRLGERGDPDQPDPARAVRVHPGPAEGVRRPADARCRGGRDGRRSRADGRWPVRRSVAGVHAVHHAPGARGGRSRPGSEVVMAA